MIQKYEKYVCPHHCGWHRTFAREGVWPRHSIKHPVYGQATQLAVAVMEINSHDCLAHIGALNRIRVLQAQWEDTFPHKKDKDSNDPENT